MASKKWCIALTGLRAGPNGRKILDIPPGAIIDYTGNQEPGRLDGHEILWSEVVYRGRTAWVNDRLLEDYVEKYPEAVRIPNPSAEPNDAAQYLMLDGYIKYNMCGELCAAYIGGDDIDTFLAKWSEAAPNFYKWAVQGDNDNPTGIDALESMLKVYGYQFPVLRFQAGLTDPVIGFKISPGRLKRMLETHYLIANVNIDAYTGKLRGSVTGWCWTRSNPTASTAAGSKFTIPSPTAARNTPTTSSSTRQAPPGPDCGCGGPPPPSLCRSPPPCQRPNPSPPLELSIPSV